VQPRAIWRGRRNTGRSVDADRYRALTRNRLMIHKTQRTSIVRLPQDAPHSRIRYRRRKAPLDFRTNNESVGLLAQRIDKRDLRGQF